MICIAAGRDLGCNTLTDSVGTDPFRLEGHAATIAAQWSARALGVWAGFPLADPIVSLLITVAILGIVWQSARAVLTRMLDGVEPELIDEIEHAGAHVPGLQKVIEIRARWLGHKLHVDIAIAVEENFLLSEALRHELFEHIPALSVALVRFGQ